MGVWNSPASRATPFLLIWCTMSKDKDMSKQGGPDPVPWRFLTGKQISIERMKTLLSQEQSRAQKYLLCTEIPAGTQVWTNASMKSHLPPSPTSLALVMTAIHLQHALSHDYLLLTVLTCSHTAIYLSKQKGNGCMLTKIVVGNFKWSE